MTASNPYAVDGKCHNAEPGTWNQECGKPATWIGTTVSGFRMGFCNECRECGTEARFMRYWEQMEGCGPALDA